MRGVKASTDHTHHSIHQTSALLLHKRLDSRQAEDATGQRRRGRHLGGNEGAEGGERVEVVADELHDVGQVVEVGLHDEERLKSRELLLTKGTKGSTRLCTPLQSDRQRGCAPGACARVPRRRGRRRGRRSAVACALEACVSRPLLSENPLCRLFRASGAFDAAQRTAMTSPLRKTAPSVKLTYSSTGACQPVGESGALCVSTCLTQCRPIFSPQQQP